MLPITRKTGQSFHIGDDIVAYVTWARNGEARIAIDAPRDCTILRSELLDDRTHPLPVPDVDFLSE